MNEIRVLPVGCEVRIQGEIPAVIHAISIRAMGYTQYEVVWWDGRTRVVEWVGDREIKPLYEGEEIQIGFKTGSPEK